MTLQEALQRLQIEEFESRIFNSHSNGELSHLHDYIYLAENVTDAKLFKKWFLGEVKEAEKSWNRPESVFQHILKILEAQLEDREIED